MAIELTGEYTELNIAVEYIKERKNQPFFSIENLYNRALSSKTCSETDKSDNLILSIIFTEKSQKLLKNNLPVLTEEEHSKKYNDKENDVKARLDFIDDSMKQSDGKTIFYIYNAPKETPMYNEVEQGELFDLPLIGSERNEIKNLANPSQTKDQENESSKESRFGYMLKKPGELVYYQLLNGSSIKMEPVHSRPSYSSLVIRNKVLEHFVKSLTNNKTIGKKSEKNGHSSPWKIKAPRDPEPEQYWYTSARYFARVFVREDPSLAGKRHILAAKVRDAMARVEDFKRGGKKPPAASTILKAFSNITFDWIY